MDALLHDIRTRLIANQSYDVEATDLATFVGVTLLLLVVAIGAMLVPALRATRVDPLAVLRENDVTGVRLWDAESQVRTGAGQ